MKFLQKLGKAIMLPVACLPLCGILMGIGYLLCPASMQGGAITGTPAAVGMFLVKAGGAGNMADCTAGAGGLCDFLCSVPVFDYKI